MTPSSEQPSGIRLVLDIQLTPQQRQIMLEFGRPDDPFEQSSETISACGVREWPTCHNLIELGLVKWLEYGPGGNHYAITPAGVEVLRGLRSKIEQERSS